MKRSKHGATDESSRQKETASVTRTELELEQGRFKLTWLDWFAAPLVALLASVLVFPNVGTAVNWDDLLYMNLSQYTTPHAWVLNRYGHVYLMKFFFWFTGDAITGGRVYWTFLFFATCVLIYWCTRIIGGKRTYLAGVVAVLLFCTQPVWIRHLGCPLVDFAIMFLVMLGIFVYLAFIRGNHKHRNIAILILGLIFFWAVKSKEIGICMGVLFLGLGEDKTGLRSMRQFVRDIRWALLGMIAGCVLLMVLDLTFMGDAWFSIRPSSIRDLFGYNTAVKSSVQKNSSWYIILAWGPSLPILLLYLLKGQSLSKRDTVVWLIPLLILFFITAVTIRVNRTFPERFLIPVIAGMCIWAAQFFEFEVIKSKKLGKLSKTLMSSVLVLFAFLTVLSVMHRIEVLTNTDGWFKANGWKSVDRVYDCVILPFFTSAFLIYMVVFKKRGQVALFFSSLCLFFIVYFPLANNLTLLNQRVTAKKGEWRFAPYRVFADEMRFGKDVKILVSKDVHARSWMLGRDVRSHCWMFNVFFNQKFDYDNFIDGSWEDVLKGDYSYAFLTRRDWKSISQKHNVGHLLKDYALKTDKKTQLILLKKR